MVTVDGLFTPQQETLGQRVRAALASAEWTSLRAAVAFVKLSGVKLLYDELDAFGNRNPGAISLSVGIDHGGSSAEAVSALYSLTTAHGGELWIVNNPQGSPRPTFHPKMWLFSSDTDAKLLLVGSGNMTRGGLYTNYEASVAIRAHTQERVIVDAGAFLDAVRDGNRPDVRLATTEVLQELHNEGHLPSEPEGNRVAAASNSLRGLTSRGRSRQPKFPGLRFEISVPPNSSNVPECQLNLRRPPSFGRDAVARDSDERPRGPEASESASSGGPPQHTAFYITIRMGVKTEVFLAKTPLEEDPAFFGAPFWGHTTPKSANNVAQPQADPMPLVSIKLHTAPPVEVDNHPLKLWTYTHGSSANDDFRTNFTAEVNKQIPLDSVARFERDPPEYGHLQFVIDIYPPGHARYAEMRAKCDRTLPGGKRHYGWE